MALIARKKFSYVTIEPGDDHGGLVMLSADRTGKRRQIFVATKKSGVYRAKTAEELRDEGHSIERYILILVSGYVASRILYEADEARVGEASWERFTRHADGASGDYKAAYRYASELVEPCHTRKLSAGHNEPETIVSALEKHAYLTLKHPQIWAGVQEMAGLLLQKPRIGYKEARRVFSAAYWANEKHAK
jgi:hypothetical protein